jgi:hypothetical protein
MKKILLLSVLLPSILYSQSDNSKRVVLIKEKLVAQNQYMIVARGYPKPGLTEKLQIDGTAKEAALLNAQVIARQRFIESLDTIQNGSAKSYSMGNGYADVTYIITYPGVKRYLKKK